MNGDLCYIIENDMMISSMHELLDQMKSDKFEIAYGSRIASMNLPRDYGDACNDPLRNVHLTLTSGEKLECGLLVSVTWCCMRNNVGPGWNVGHMMDGCTFGFSSQMLFLPQTFSRSAWLLASVLWWLDWVMFYTLTWVICMPWAPHGDLGLHGLPKLMMVWTMYRGIYSNSGWYGNKTEGVYWNVIITRPYSTYQLQ